MSQPRRRNELGDVGENVRLNVRRIRDAWGYSTTQLSDMLAEAGRVIHASAVTKIEAGDRRVDAGDLVALANALDVSPMTLLSPPGLRSSLGRRNTFSGAMFELALDHGLDAAELLAELTKEAAALAATAVRKRIPTALLDKPAVAYHEEDENAPRAGE